MHLYDDQFSKKHNFNHNKSTNKVLIICSTPRCGSHMLGHALFETKQFGFPLEYTNPANLAEWCKRLNTNSLESTIAKLQEIRTSENGVFSIKVHYSHIEQFGSLDNVRSMFPHAYFVILSRKEALKQAISLVIANQTGVWIDGQKEIASKANYDSSAIEEALKGIIQDTASWRYDLSLRGCNFIEMNFDDVKEDLELSISKIADFMEIKIDKAKIPLTPTTKKQGANINNQWMKRFINEADGINGVFRNVSKRFNLFKSFKKRCM
jgi:LPS sulfotransferase NodH